MSTSTSTHTQALKDEEEVFSWTNFRDERKKKEKEGKKKKKTSSKPKKCSKESSNPKDKDKSKQDKDNDASFSMLDSSDRTEATTNMTESESTMCSLQQEQPEPEPEHGASSEFCFDFDYSAVELWQDNVLDHMVLAAPDLEAAIVEFHEKTGVKPVKTGHINGLGISKARVAFKGSSFLEIIAPDPEPEREGPIGQLLQSLKLTGLTPFHWAIRASRAATLATEVTQKGLGYTPDLLRMSGPGKDGTCKKWEELYLYGHDLGGVCPFFIHWDTFDHPSETKTVPIVGELLGVKICAPAEDKMHRLLAHTGSTGFTLEEGSPHFEVKFRSPNGEVVFAADNITGFKIPGIQDTAAHNNEKKVDETPAAAAADNKNEKKAALPSAVEHLSLPPPANRPEKKVPKQRTKSSKKRDTKKATKRSKMMADIIAVETTATAAATATTEAEEGETQVVTNTTLLPVIVVEAVKPAVGLANSSKNEALQSSVLLDEPTTIVDDVPEDATCDPSEEWEEGMLMYPVDSIGDSIHQSGGKLPSISEH